MLEGMDEEVTVVPGEDKARGYCSAPCSEKTAVPLTTPLCNAVHCVNMGGKQVLSHTPTGGTRFIGIRWSDLLIIYCQTCSMYGGI